MSKKASIGIGIGVGIIAIVIGISAVMYQDNFDDNNGTTQPTSKVGLSDEVELTVEKKSEETKTSESKSYKFQINETLGLSNPP